MKIQETDDFKQVIWKNYLEHSNGMTMREYATKEKKMLLMGNYGVEEYHIPVKAYIDFLDELIY
ncbi:hypothetical protein M3P19_00890 [Muricauda sp. 2012CJ35-5]|uniref:Uncharacterized protein n=1 Tax=Flagellimonas spongiicola TaxID=2942208 RepID=A0ABT0PMR5_9FLAO|nr:hypothetical protein [Allomuricauda spongiicola]MCL6272541.1 hypothetical protein [Allomuricauda spongiicola]